MKTADQRGSVLQTALLAITVMLLLMVSGFAFWAFGERSTYKDKSDKKAAEAVEVAKADLTIELEKKFADEMKSPFDTYTGPQEYGSIQLKYPRTWSAFVEKGGNTPLNGYFHPGQVPGTSDETSFALRLELTDRPYSEELKGYDNDVKGGKVAVVAYQPAAVPSITGARLDGEVQNNKSGAMIMIPLRDKTLKLWTESQDFIKDFNDNILPNLTFVP